MNTPPTRIPAAAAAAGGAIGAVGPEELTVFDDPADPRLALGATGLLREFNDAGLLHAPDVHVARRLGELGGETDDRVLLAAALAVRGLREGSVCVDLSELPGIAPQLPWPAEPGWGSAVAASSLVGADRPLRLDLGLLYLDRYWRQEDQVHADLVARSTVEQPAIDADMLQHSLDRLFPDRASRQRLAAGVAARRWTAVLGGGPGTGKTTTVALILAVLADLSRQADPAAAGLRMALAAPTGKAAARLQEAVQDAVHFLPAADRERLGPLSASTLHRLLGFRPGSSTRFRHDRDNRLPHDVVVVDETSMLSLTLMARLLEAVRPDARLLLVGDPDQLASVEAGAVLADLVTGLTGHGAFAGSGEPAERPPTVERDAERGVVLLDRTWRFKGAIARLAAAVRAGDPDEALAVIHSGESEVELLDPGAPGVEDAVRRDVVEAADLIRAEAFAGRGIEALGHLGRHRLLCGPRGGPHGVEQWARTIERWLADAHGVRHAGQWYVGRPLLVTANDYSLGLYNGDTGVVVAESDGSLRAAFARGSELVTFAPSRLAAVETVHAMTVHRSQGSQFQAVTVVLPPAGTPLSTREMVYTAITRAQDRVRLLGTEDDLAAAISRPAARASGLRRRLAR